MEITRRLHLTLADQARDRYPRIPFDLPEDATSFEVQITVEKAGHGAGIDLGCEGPDGFRGWSGGARKSFVITREDATPGYLPGRLVGGAWYVVLGIHTLPAEGSDVGIRVVSPAEHVPDHGPVEDPAPRETRGSERGLPAPAGMTWFAGDPHNHCLHSDGELSLWELANEGIKSGLDFLGCTDHNTTSHHAHLADVGSRQGITLVPGQEMTTHRGHANAWGEIGFVDFRRPAQEWVDEVERRGGFMSINHPVSGDCSWLHPLQTLPPAAELYHGSWFAEPIDTAIFAWYQRWGSDLIAMGGGDFHNRSTPLRPGMPTTWIAAEECTPDALIEGMKAGRTTVTGSAHLVSPGEARPILFDVPTLIRQGEDLACIDAVGTVLVDGQGNRQVIAQKDQKIRAPRRFGPFRLEHADRGVAALCS